MPFLRKIWAQKGTKPIGIFWWSNKKANLFGALINGQKLYYEWYDKLNSQYFIEFISRFVKTLDKNKKYVFVFDNAPAHKSKISQKYLNSLKKNIFIEFLPTYSPQLNCIETCWKIVRYSVTNSNWFQTIENLQEGIEEFLSKYFFTLNPTKYLSR